MASILRIMTFLTLLAIISMSTASTTANYKCPERCRCRHAIQQQSVIVDCSNQALLEVPRDLDPASVHLDLSGNQITTLRSGAFDGFGSLATILLNDNQISKIEAHALRGLGAVRDLDLRRNKLSELSTDSLAGMHGAIDCSSTNPCTINIQENPLRRIESYAMSWCKGLSLMFGRSDTDLVIEPYAFYGTENILRIQLSDLPSIKLEPRIFTNTYLVKILEISDTEIKTLEGFTFEGLKNAAEIHFRNCQFGVIEEFAFSGILYSPSTKSQVTAYSHGNSQRAGGILNISGSTLPSLPADGFRDTNLENLIFYNNEIGVIHGHSFRGLHGLALLELTNNDITTVKPYAFSSLKNVPHVKLGENNLSHLSENAFKDSKGISRLSLYVRRNTSLTLPAYSFSGLREVGVLEIKGAPGATFIVDKDAFHDLGGVTTLEISNVSLPFLGQHTFRGLSKVQTLRLEYCNISRIDSSAFGGSAGTVTTIELKEGNNMPCDCETNKLLRNFESRFAQYTVSCTGVDSTRKVLTPDTSDWPSCSGAESVPLMHHVVLWSAISSFLWNYL